jgi:hypothetical protein
MSNMYVQLTLLKTKRFRVGQYVYNCNEVKIDELGVWINRQFVDKDTNVMNMGVFSVKSKYVQNVTAKNISLKCEKNVTRLVLTNGCNVSIHGNVSTLTTSSGGFVSCNVAKVVKTFSANIINQESSEMFKFQHSQPQVIFSENILSVFASQCDISIDGSVITVDGDCPSVSVSGDVSIIDIGEANPPRSFGTMRSLVAVNHVGSVLTSAGHIVLHEASYASSHFGVVMIQKDGREITDNLNERESETTSIKRKAPSRSSSPQIESEDNEVQLEKGFENLTCDALFGEDCHDVKFDHEISKAIFGPVFDNPQHQIDVTSQLIGCDGITFLGKLSEFFNWSQAKEYCYLQVWYKHPQ